MITGFVRNSQRSETTNWIWTRNRE